MRVLLPGAEQVIVLNAGSGRALMALRLRHAGGLFEGVIPRRHKLFDYRLQVRWRDNPESVVNIYADAYAFGMQLRDEDLTALREGRHPRPYTVLGAHAMPQRRVDMAFVLRYGRPMPGASVSLATSTSGMAGATRCGYVTWPVFGRFSCLMA